MAITKFLHMKENKNGAIDAHLKQAVAYILNPVKLGEANLAGGINCLPETAYEQMVSTKEMYGKLGGRQGYHAIISLPPGEGTPQDMYDIACEFARKAFHDEYEIVIAVHTDREHLHAHLVFNSVNMITGYKYQYHNGDWKKHYQPITNELCDKYGYTIMPAEYSEDSKNMSRPEWEREKSYSTLIKDDARYCALLAEDEGHFLYLMCKLGYEVKEGMHVAVKTSGMKRFKRLDTISEEFTRDNLAALIKYGDERGVKPKTYTFNPIYVKRSKLSPYQKKYYARMYRLRLIEKNRFIYQSATYYQDICKMHELQEEYLLIVRNNINSVQELLDLQNSIKMRRSEIVGEQKELYKQHSAEKKSCKNEKEFFVFQQNERSYHAKLEKLKTEKKDLKHQEQIIERCFKREFSSRETELEKRIHVGEMLDAEINTIAKADVPKNPLNTMKSENAETVDMIEVMEVGIEAEMPDIERFDDKVSHEKIIDIEMNSVGNVKEQQEVLKTKLPVEHSEYELLSMEEKVKLFDVHTLPENEIFKTISDYLSSALFEYSFNEIFEEYQCITNFYRKKQIELLVSKEVESVMDNMNAAGVMAEEFDNLNYADKAALFDFGDMEYNIGMKVYRGVLDRLEIKKDFNELYDEFGKMYEASVGKIEHGNAKWGKQK